MTSVSNGMTTIKNNAVVDWEISKSQFIAFAYYVESEIECQEYIKQLWQEYPKATHICWGAKIGQSIERFDDNGEPSYTAGMPILDVIKKQGLTNLLIAVVRFYGGIKLGAGGLVRAYSKSASMVLKSCEIVNLNEVAVYSFDITYDYHLKVVTALFLKNPNIFIIKTNYENLVTITFYVLKQFEHDFLLSLQKEEKVQNLVYLEDKVIKQVLY